MQVRFWTLLWQVPATLFSKRWESALLGQCGQRYPFPFDGKSGGDGCFDEN